MTQYPTAAYAADAGMPLAEYEEFVTRAMFLDRPDPRAAWQELGRRQAGLVEFMSGVTIVRIEADGTDLTLSVAGRTWINSDGRRNMPSGEIFTGPIEDSATGRLRCGFPVCRDGRELVGISLEFQRGTGRAGHDAEQGEDYLLAMLELDPGARRLGELGLGLNCGIDRFTGSILYDEKIGGTVHLALGPELSRDRRRQQFGPALGPDRRHENTGPDHGRRPARHGKRTLAGGLIDAVGTANTRNRRVSSCSDASLRRTLCVGFFSAFALFAVRAPPAAHAQADGGRRAQDRVLPARRPPRRRQGRGSRDGDGQLDQARVQDPAAPPRPRDGQERRAQGSGSNSIRAALTREARRDQHRREQGHDQGQGNPPERGTAAASETVGQCDHRPARAARRRGHEPRVRPRSARQAVLRGPG